MMKKFLTILMLGLVVFAVSCSAEDSFKNQVKGKTITLMYYGQPTGVSVIFSADGSSFTLGGYYTFNFVSATDSNNATYTAYSDGLQSQAAISINGTSVTFTETYSGYVDGEYTTGTYVYTGTLS